MFMQKQFFTYNKLGCFRMQVACMLYKS